jgi:hypothetical protein
MPVIPALHSKDRAKGDQEVEASLGYIASSRLGWVTK